MTQEEKTNTIRGLLCAMEIIENPVLTQREKAVVTEALNAMLEKGCDGCRYRHKDKYDLPCWICTRSHKDMYERR